MSQFQNCHLMCADVTLGRREQEVALVVPVAVAVVTAVDATLVAVTDAVTCSRVIFVASTTVCVAFVSAVT